MQDRIILTALLYVLKTGIQWNELPQNAFNVSGVTCWRRHQLWASLDIWDPIHRVLLEKLDQAHLIDWERLLIDSASVAAKKGVEMSEEIRQIEEKEERNGMS